MTSFLLVEDQAPVRHALRMQIELVLGYRVVGEAGTIADGVALAQWLQPDIVILDIGLPDGDGICALAPLRRACFPSRDHRLRGQH